MKIQISKYLTLISFTFVVSFFISFPVQSQTLHLTTEHYPPYNIDLSREEGGENIKKGSKEALGGFSTEIVFELMKRTNYLYDVSLLPWRRAYASAKDNNFTAVFSTTRTESREKLFQWVGPIAENQYAFITTDKSNISLNSIEDANNYTIGAYAGSAAATILEEQGITAQLSSTDDSNALKLQNGRIDLWFTGLTQGLYIAKQNNVTGLKAAFKTPPRYMYMAFNLDTPKPIITKLSQTLEQMKEEGFLDAAYAKYR